nr:FYN-binding protein 1 [Anas platyrhynchos]
MDSKTDVKSLMAKFNAGNNPSEDVSGNSRPFKIAGQPLHSGLQTRKAALEKFASQGNATTPSGPSTFHKPVHPKTALGVKPSADDKTEKDPKPPYLKPVAQRFGVQLQTTNRDNDGKTGCTKPTTKTSDLAKEEPKPLYPKPAGNKPLSTAPHEKEKRPLGTKPNSNFAPQESEAKPVFSKVAGVKEKFMSASQENEPRPPSSKPALAQKPSLNHEVSHSEDTSSKNALLHKGVAGPRPKIHSFKAAKETDENSNCAAETASSHFANMALKPTGHWSSSSQGTAKNMDEKTEEKGVSAARNIFLNKVSQEESGSSPPKFRKMSTAFAAGKSLGGSEEKEDGDKSSGAPKRKALPPLFKLGQPPQKPCRPPSVDLEKFQKSIPKDSESSLFFVCFSSQSGGRNGAGKMFPPPPSDQEIYDGVDDTDTVTRSVSQDEDKNDTWSWGILKKLKVKDNKKKSVREKATKVNGAEDNGDLSLSTKQFGKDCGDSDVYDDVDSSDFPPPPDFSSPKPVNLGKGKSDEKDPQKLKKMEREEKEFRKKFKFEGEIKVLYSTTTVQDLPQRKWGSKDLQVKPGESLEIIQNTDDTKVLCRNEEGKYGYVLRSNLVENDGEIYDDIGDDCIYDND